MRKFGWGLLMVLCVAMAIYAWRFLVLSPETLFPDSYDGEGPRRVPSASQAKATA